MHKIFKLSNGIPVVTESSDYVKSVSAGVWIYAGSAMENIKNALSDSSLGRKE